MIRLSDILKKYWEKAKKDETEDLKPHVKSEAEVEQAKPTPPVQEPKVSVSSAVCRGLGKISSADIAGLYAELLSRTKQIYVSDLKQCFTPWVNEAVEKLADTLSSGNNEELLKICSADYIKVEDYLYGHAVNVAILAIEIGIELGYERGRLVELGIASLVHDIGLVKYLDIINQNKILDKEEHDKIKEHPNAGAEILNRISKEIGPGIIEVVKQEHERIDGSGYPLGLKGDEISEFAKIIGLVDVYESKLHSRPYRAKFKSLETINAIIKAKQAFESQFIKILIERVGIFPVGIQVRLNTKEIGVVVKENPQLALRPVVNILFDAQKKKLREPKQIDLAENPIIYIEDGIDEVLPEIESEEEKE